MKNNWWLIAAVVWFAVVGRADPLPGPVPDSLIVSYSGLQWVWASPCAGECSMPLPTYQEGWRYATGEEWVLRPEYTAFLNADGTVKCASPYFDPVWTHCDGTDGELGFVTSYPNDSPHESWFVRGGHDLSGQVPEPASMILVGSGLAAAVRSRFWK